MLINTAAVQEIFKVLRCFYSPMLLSLHCCNICTSYSLNLNVLQMYHVQQFVT